MLLLHQGIILYQSKYGTTQKYANWLSDKTEFDCVAVNKADIKKSCSIMNSIGTFSYTHLDVYKRQRQTNVLLLSFVFLNLMRKAILLW